VLIKTPAGARILNITLAASMMAGVTCSVRAGTALEEAKLWSSLGRTGWRHNRQSDEAITDNTNLSYEQRRAIVAMKAGKHDDPAVRAVVLPMVQRAISNLADDNHKWNAHGARNFLEITGQFATPFLELKMITGDRQQRSHCVELLARARSVSDPAAVARGIVGNLADDNYGDPTRNSLSAFNRLARSDQLLQLAKPALIESLSSDDAQLRFNSAQLLCIYGEEDQAERLVEILSPLLDDDDAQGTACSSVACLSLLGSAAIDPLRACRINRDEQGRLLVDHLLFRLAGPGTPHARELTEKARKKITSLVYDPINISMINLLVGSGNKIQYGHGSGFSPWASSRRWRHRPYPNNQRTPEQKYEPWVRETLSLGPRALVETMMQRQLNHYYRQWPRAEYELIQQTFDRLLVSEGIRPADPLWCAQNLRIDQPVR
jgi:hypothetical protein